MRSLSTLFAMLVVTVAVASPSFAAVPLTAAPDAAKLTAPSNPAIKIPTTPGTSPTLMPAPSTTKPHFAGGRDDEDSDDDADKERPKSA
jgi:hypothetical protein